MCSDYKLGPTENTRTDLSRLGLSSTARSILSMANVEYRCRYVRSCQGLADTIPDPTPDDEDTIVMDNSAKAMVNHRLPIPAESRASPAQQATFNGAQITKSTPSKLVVQVPAKPDAYRKEDYVTIEGSPKRRKVSHEDRALRTQQQQAEEAVASFEDSLSDIFEAEDLMNAADGSITQHRKYLYFDDLDEEGDGLPTLNVATLDKLRDELRKLHNLHLLSKVPPESMQRLQKLCEPAVERGQTINFEPPSEEHADEKRWHKTLSQANISLASAVVAIYTMLGHSEDESLVSMDMLRWSATSLVNAFENCLMSVIEARPDTTDKTLWTFARSSVDLLKQLLNTARRLLELLATACVDVKGGASSVNAVDFLAAKLIFVQNAPQDKNAALGTTIYENFRKIAMATLARLYARFPRERQAILHEILSSLDKLPSTSRSARTFRVGDGHSIQLITALFMQLVQTTAMEVPKQKVSKLRKIHRGTNAQTDSDEEAGEPQVEEMPQPPSESEDDSADEADPLPRLEHKVDQRFKPASVSAANIISFLVDKASKTTKTGDSPYRNILDLLVEDLITVIDQPDWPSAELLLNILASQMLDHARSAKTASIKNMALESLGVMSAAISRLRSKITSTYVNLEKDDSEAARELSRLLDSYKEAGHLPQISLFSLKGPFMLVAEHFQTLSGKVTLHQQSARAFFAAYVAFHTTRTARSSNGQLDVSDIVAHLFDIMTSKSDGPATALTDVSASVAKTAFLLSVLNLSFCNRLHTMVKALSSSLTSDQAQVKSRSLKSVSVVLEIDSSLLDRDASIAEDVFRCAADESAMVRDSALALIARFIIPRGGQLEKTGIERILDCVADEKPGVQKKAIIQLKDIYLSDRMDKRPGLKNRTLQVLLKRVTDLEESVVSLVEQTLEEVLILPVSNIIKMQEQAAAAEVAVEELAVCLMNCLQGGPTVFMPLLKKLITLMLRREKKSFTTNREVCAKLVQALFKQVIGTEKTRAPLLVLTALAEADPQLVPPLQLEKLQIYLSDIKQNDQDDLFMFRSAVTIFRLVLPGLSDSHRTLLGDIQMRLMQAIQKVPTRLELDAIMQCLATIDAVLHNTERLVRFSKSVLEKLADPNTPFEARLKLLPMIGTFGKYIEIDKLDATFRRLMPDAKLKSVSDFMVKTILPMTTKKYPIAVQLGAFESMGAICQQYPAHLNKPWVRVPLFEILDSVTASATPDQQKLVAIVLNIFDELFATRAAAKEQEKKEDEDEEKQALKQMGGDTRSQEADSAINTITPAVTDKVLKISLSESNDNALPAARTLASISHQGLIHPKQCLGAFVAFGTSKDEQIAAIGHRAQHLLHEQHESHCEREYMSAMAYAFRYQHDVEHTPAGAISSGQAGFKPKLGACFGIIATSNIKYVKKYLAQLVKETTFDSPSTEKPLPSTDHMMYTRFIIQNIAFFEYKKLDELLHVALQLELAYGKIGTEIANLIEDAFKHHPEILTTQQVPGDPELGREARIIETSQTNPNLIIEIKRLVPAAATLMLVIETRSHLLRQYGISRDIRAALVNTKQAKESTKVPVKVHGITGEKFWLSSNEIVRRAEHEPDILQLCQDFVAAVSIEDDMDFDMNEAGGPVVSGDASMIELGQTVIAHGVTPAGTARKRKLTPVDGGTPSKRARGRPKKSVQRRSSSVSTDGDPDADFEG